jgi:hypothetical protein
VNGGSTARAAGALLIVGLGNALLGAWWLDPASALIAAVAVKEGREGCRVATPPSLGADESAGCDDDCCA